MKSLEIKIWLHIILVILLSLIGCTYGKYITHYHFNNIKIIEPDLGVVATASLGNPIIETSNGHFSKTLKINQTYNRNVSGGTMYINKGLYELIHSDDKYDYYNPIESENTYYIIQGKKQPGYSNCQIRVSSDVEIELILPSGQILPKFYTPEFNFTFEDSSFVLAKDSFQQTLIYLGKNNDILKFNYREFQNNLIRDSFSTEITYDLSESNIIGYKNFKAEIINATNSNLTYKIISGF